MMRMSMRILVLVMCLCTTWCFGMLPRQSMGGAKGDFDVGTEDSSDHADAPVVDIAVPMPCNSMRSATDGTDDNRNYDDIAVMDIAAADSAQVKPPSLDARMVRVKGREVSCMDNG